MKKTSFGCAVCDDLAHETTMIGDYHTRLCDDHRNEFNLDTREHKLWIKLHETGVDLAIAINRNDNDEAKDLIIERNKIMGFLYHFSEAWVLSSQVAWKTAHEGET